MATPLPALPVPLPLDPSERFPNDCPDCGLPPDTFGLTLCDGCRAEVCADCWSANHTGHSLPD